MIRKTDLSIEADAHLKEGCTDVYDEDGNEIEDEITFEVRITVQGKTCPFIMDAFFREFEFEPEEKIKKMVDDVNIRIKTKVLKHFKDNLPDIKQDLFNKMLEAYKSVYYY